MTVGFLNPRIVCHAIRFITPDVSLADGAWTYREKGGKVQNCAAVVRDEEGRRVVEDCLTPSTA